MIISLGQERAGLYASRACLSCMSYCLSFSLPFGVEGWLRLVIVALPGLFTSFLSTDQCSVLQVVSVFSDLALEACSLLENKNGVLEDKICNYLNQVPNVPPV